MQDTDCVEFLRWALPEMQLRWQGFRKVRRGVCKRISRRMKELGLSDIQAYRAYLTTHSDEWTFLNGLCRVSISRFYRDRDVFETLEKEVFPTLIEQARSRSPLSKEVVIRCWSVGCASGEEPYTLSLIWSLRLGSRNAGIKFEIIATDADPYLIERCRQGIYQTSSLRDLPDGWVETGLDQAEGKFRVKEEFRQNISFMNQDLLTDIPPGEFDLILCRNFVFTYWGQTQQEKALIRLENKLVSGGFLVIGKHEFLPETRSGLLLWRKAKQIFQKS